MAGLLGEDGLHARSVEATVPGTERSTSRAGHGSAATWSVGNHRYAIEPRLWFTEGRAVMGVAEGRMRGERAAILTVR